MTPARAAGRVKLAVFRHDLSDHRRSSWAATGLVAGVLAAVATLWTATRDPALLAIVLGLWWLGWIAGPLVMPSGEVLSGRHLTPLGLRRHALVLCLLGAAAVGVGSLSTVVALGALVLHGSRYGAPASLVGLAVLAPLMVFIIGSSHVARIAYGRLLHTRRGALLSSVASEAVLASAAQGWALIAALFSADVVGTLAGAARWVPTGWAMVAVDAAGEGDWATAACLGVALLATAAGVSVLWIHLAAREASGGRPPSGRASGLFRAEDARQAMVAKTMLAMVRDPLAVHRVGFAASYAIAFCAMPLAVGWDGLIPWTGPLFAVMFTATAANLYGNDGSSLWLPLSIPGAVALDLAAKMRVHFIAVAVTTTSMTAVTLAMVRSSHPLLVVTASMAVILASPGVSVLVSTWAPTPTTDLHQRPTNPLDTGAGTSEAGGIYLALTLAGLAAGPPVALAYVAGGWGLVAAPVLGLLIWWAGAAAARWRLQHHGPELLQELRGGSVAREVRDGPVQRSSWQRRWVVRILVAGGMIALVPQGVLPLGLLASGSDLRAWFLPMHLTSPSNWVAAACMVLGGVALLSLAGQVLARSTHAAKGRNSVSPSNEWPTL